VQLIPPRVQTAPGLPRTPVFLESPKKKKYQQKTANSTSCCCTTTAPTPHCPGSRDSFVMGMCWRQVGPSIPADRGQVQPLGSSSYYIISKTFPVTDDDEQQPWQASSPKGWVSRVASTPVQKRTNNSIVPMRFENCTCSTEIYLHRQILLHTTAAGTFARDCCHHRQTDCSTVLFCTSCPAQKMWKHFCGHASR
jgi:hypothetical protein